MNNAYELIEKRRIGDLNSEGYLLRHKKTGARIMILSNDDENKVFYIGFRTPPYDSTGLPHILEHSVLCGCEKYPAKDPFVELCKGSLNTFLNAMTYPDKTVYPVASCNDKDFQNLIDVYMDSVFHPNIYKREQIFRQEGHRYELFDKDDDIKINGVVYNEMKGAFSSPDDLLSREILNSLYPDTAYGVESGGDPDVIPTLTYEKFLEFHSTYYHPSNSYIYLYGNVDIDGKLDYLDREYLSKYEMLEIDSSLKVQDKFRETKRIEKSYPITQDEPLEDNTYLSYNCVLETSLDKELYLAFQIIDYCLISAPGAIITERLLKSGILQDVDSMYENGILQPYYSIIAKGSNKESLDEFLHIIKDALEDTVKSGFDKDMLKAAINIFEFRYREADFGRYPKGLMYGLQALDSWLYDDNEPFMHIEANDTFGLLREKLDSDYFERLIEKYLLGNAHSSIVVLEPKQGLTAIKDKELADKLYEYKKSLSDEEIQKLIDDSVSLKKYQEEPSTKEELETIPLLKISDIKKEAKKYIYEEVLIDDGVGASGDADRDDDAVGASGDADRTGDAVCSNGDGDDSVFGRRLITHDIFTNGIGYVTYYFNINGVPKSYLPYVGILSNVLGFLNTKNYTYTELNNKININTGGIVTNIITMPDNEDIEKYTVFFRVSSKMLYDKMPVSFELVKELLLNTVFDDEGRLLELLQMIKMRVQTELMSAGHSAAVKRALSYIYEVKEKEELVGGIDFYKTIGRIIDEYDQRKGELVKVLYELQNAIFRKENLIIDVISEKKAVDEAKKLAAEFYGSLNIADVIYGDVEMLGLEKAHKNEGFKTAGKIQFVAKAGNFAAKGLEYTSALSVLKVIMGYDYLWNNIRVIGGAYGCMSGFAKNGMSYFVSYRDPNLKKTLDIYDAAADYISNFKASERDMTKYIIGTIADVDVPLNPYDEGTLGFGAYYCHKSNEERQHNRDVILSCTDETIRGLSEYIRAFTGDECICVIGSEEKIKENGGLFNAVYELI